MFNQYPYLNLNDLNLDYILKAIKEMRYDVTNFVSINAIKYADPIQWNITSQYEKNTIVIDPVTGTAYISVAPVPAGVALIRPEYWTVVFDLGSFVTRAAQNFTSHWESETTTTATFPTTAGGWLVWGDVLYKALTNITAGDTYVINGNIEHFTIEDLYNTYLNTIAAILAVIGELSDLRTSDKTSIVNAMNSVIDDFDLTIGDLSTLATTDKSSIVNAINSVINDFDLIIGDLSNLATTDKSSIVNAINEIINNVDNIYIHDIILNVPTDYADANAAIDFLKHKIIGNNVSIKYADGTYNGNQLTAFAIDLSNVSIIGNVSDPTQVVINIGTGETAFNIRESKIGLINGFKINGTTRGNVDLITDMSQYVPWSGVNIGIIAQYNSFALLGKSIIVCNCYYGIQSVYNSCIETLTGDSVDTATIVANLTSDKEYYAGHNITVYNSGDVAVQAYADSSIDAFDIITFCGKDENSKLGYGLMSEDGSYIRVNRCYSLWNWAASLVAQSGSSLVSNDCICWNDEHHSVLVYDGYATLTNFSIKSKYGLRAIAGSVKSNGGTCELTTNQINTCYELINSTMTLYAATNAYNGKYGFYMDNESNIVNEVNMVFYGNGNVYNWFKPIYISTTIPAGTFPNGMLVLNPNGTENAGWYNTLNGWEKLGRFSEIAGDMKYDTVNGISQYYDGSSWVNVPAWWGATRYDTARHVLQYYDRGADIWYDLTELVLTTPQTGEVRYSGGALEYWDGTQWTNV